MPGDGSGYRVAGPRGKRNGEKVILTIRRDGAKLADPAPDPAGTDITGGWEGTNVFLRLNRAGNHVEGWHTDYRTKTITPLGVMLEARKSLLFVKVQHSKISSARYR